MLLLLSPAKLMRPSNAASDANLVFKKESNLVVKQLKQWSLEELQIRMKLSAPKAQEAYQCIQNWGNKVNESKSAPALFAYIGEAFKALDADTMNESELRYLNQKLIILSGLYGILRTQTRVEPYRLEMAQSGLLPEGQSLYAYWKNPIQNFLKKSLAKEEFIINLASAEYSNVIADSKTRMRMITPQFLEWNNGMPKSVSVFSKQARGTMVRWCAAQQIQEPDQIKSFDLLGYRFDSSRSSDLDWVFVR